MDLINKAIFDDLIESTGDNLVSLYMPTHRYGREQQQDPIRFGNLYAEMNEQLKARGMRKPDRDVFLEEIEALQSSKEFWQNQSDGLAIFISSDDLHVLRVPIPFEEFLFIGNQFQLNTLLPALVEGQHFYILALSQAEIRLFQGDRYHLSQITLDDLPTSLEEALWPDESERQLQFHSETHSPGGKGENASGFHGHAVLDDNQKNDIKRFFHQVDEGIMDILGDENAPLVFYGVEFLLPIYREVSAYPYITDKELSGNPEEIKEKNLHKEAWEIVEPLFESEQRKAIAHGKRLVNSESELASMELASIIPASFFGRVETLLIAKNQHVWGDLDASTKTFETHPAYLPDDVDLLNIAAIQSLKNSGTVYVIDRNEMPGDADIVAIFRYAMQSEPE